MILVIPIYILITLIFAWVNKVDAYANFIQGVKEGIQLVFEIFPYYMSMIFATKILIESKIVDNFLMLIGVVFPYGNEILLQGILRPISSSASMSLLFETLSKYGVNSKEGVLASIIQGSTDTTLYIITLYFGTIGVIHYKKAMIFGLTIDLIAFIGSLLIISYIVS